MPWPFPSASTWPDVRRTNVPPPGVLLTPRATARAWAMMAARRRTSGPRPCGAVEGDCVRFINRTSRTEERLLWSRDERFVAACRRGRARRDPPVLASGAVIIGSGEAMTDAVVAAMAGPTDYGLIALDMQLPPVERYLTGLADAVQQSGIADRVGMLTSPVTAYHKVMDAFLALGRRDAIGIVYQPLVSLETMTAIGYETLCRPSAAAGSIDEVVRAAVETGRTAELDRLDLRTSPQPHGPPARDPEPHHHQPPAGQPGRTVVRARGPGCAMPRHRHPPAPHHARMHGAAGGPRPDGPRAARPTAARPRLRVRCGRRRGRLRLVQPDRRPQAVAHQDRPRHRARHRPPDVQAGPRGGVRGLRATHRGGPRRRGHRTGRRPGDAARPRRHLRAGLDAGAAGQHPAAGQARARPPDPVGGRPSRQPEPQRGPTDRPSDAG